jgi:chemotaxis protein methyltransferase CheR
MKKNNYLLQNFFLPEDRINVSCYDETFLHNTLQTRMKEVNCSSTEAYYGFLKQHPDEKNKLLSSLQNGYSTFFRNSLTFAAIEHLLLPKGISNSKEIRIWSAACAAGQEAYSMAMLLEDHLNCKTKNAGYRIFATDHNKTLIERAQKGIYYTDHLDNLSKKYINRWFIKKGDYYTVKPTLKEQIDFSVFDLLDEKHSSPPSSIFGNFDFVICANLLFYYKAEYRKKMINKVINSMAEDAYLIVGETERDILLSDRFSEVYPHSAIFKKV